MGCVCVCGVGGGGDYSNPLFGEDTMGIYTFILWNMGSTGESV